MTVAKCTTVCEANKFQYAGLEYAQECCTSSILRSDLISKAYFVTGCGNTLSAPGAPAASGCDKPCKGNATEYCGGSNRRKLFPWLLAKTFAAHYGGRLQATSKYAGQPHS